MLTLYFIGALVTTSLYAAMDGLGEGEAKTWDWPAIVGGSLVTGILWPLLLFTVVPFTAARYLKTKRQERLKPAPDMDLELAKAMIEVDRLLHEDASVVEGMARRGNKMALALLTPGRHGFACSCKTCLNTYVNLRNA